MLAFPSNRTFRHIEIGSISFLTHHKKIFSSEHNISVYSFSEKFRFFCVFKSKTLDCRKVAEHALMKNTQKS